MFLTLMITFVAVVLMKSETVTAVTPATVPSSWFDLNTTAALTPINCPYFGEVEHGYVTITGDASNQIATIICAYGYDLDINPNIVYCTDGKWQVLPHPQCHERCQPPPELKNGTLKIEGIGNNNELFHKDTLVTYTCNEGFELVPKESQYRVCEKGIWTGMSGICEPIKTNCPPPRDVNNGYFVLEQKDKFDEYVVGQRLHYSCNHGYVLVGDNVQKCLKDGTWSPKIPPVCTLQITDESLACQALPYVPNSVSTVIQGYQSKKLAISGTLVQIHCINNHQNRRNPCHPAELRCISGRWVGSLPLCVPVHECDPPPNVYYSVIYNVNLNALETPDTQKYPIKSQISYQCLPGYTLRGNETFVCAQGGCWLPFEPPTCYRATSYFLQVNGMNAVLISAATGAGVLGLLLLICLITVCRRRKPLSRAVPIAPPVQRPDLGDHASLFHHPDRLALIAFADGMQNDQGALPTYDEATRDRAPNPSSSNRLHRPHWPNLGGRRSRNGPNPDMHVTRHGSFASHTPSTRSAADSMGSTDTVAVSEGSTNVTLDTASSYSGSQPASCRVHCGSLASFDTSSVVNTEGVPLLEESEFEEVQGGDNVSLVVDNPSIADNASFKLSTNSTELS